MRPRLSTNFEMKAKENLLLRSEISMMVKTMESTKKQYDGILSGYQEKLRQENILNCKLRSDIKGMREQKLQSDRKLRECMDHNAVLKDKLQISEQRNTQLIFDNDRYSEEIERRNRWITSLQSKHKHFRRTLDHCIDDGSMMEENEDDEIIDEEANDEAEMDMDEKRLSLIQKFPKCIHSLREKLNESRDQIKQSHIYWERISSSILEEKTDLEQRLDALKTHFKKAAELTALSWKAIPQSSVSGKATNANHLQIENTEGREETSPVSTELNMIRIAEKYLHDKGDSAFLRASHEM